MTLKEKYILPKFKKTDEELENKFEKWLYVFRHLSNLQNRPKALQERIFEKLFQVAEIAKFTPEEKELYEESLKYYRDLKNVIDTSKEEGKLEKAAEIAKNLKEQGLPAELISDATGLSIEQINDID